MQHARLFLRPIFVLLLPMVMLGGKGHGLSQKSAPTHAKSAKALGGLNVSPQMLTLRTPRAGPILGMAFFDREVIGKSSDNY